MKRRSNKIRVPVHFVWATRERLPLIPEEGERRLWRYIEAICREVLCDVLAVGGMPDHVHLLVNFANTLSFAEFMKRVKGGSSRFVSQDARRAAPPAEKFISPSPWWHCTVERGGF